MELDEYRILIRKQPAPSAYQIDAVATEKLIRLRSGDIAARISRSLFMEKILTGCFIILAALFAFFESGLLQKLIPLALMIYGLLFFYYLYRLWRKVQSFHTGQPIKTYLITVIEIITKFKRIYIQLTMIMIPLMIVVAVIRFYASPALVYSSGSAVFLSPSAWIFILFSLSWYAMMYIFTRWYTRKFYGTQLQRLRQQLAELEQ